MRPVVLFALKYAVLVFRKLEAEGLDLAEERSFVNAEGCRRCEAVEIIFFQGLENRLCFGGAAVPKMG